MRKSAKCSLVSKAGENQIQVGQYKADPAPLQFVNDDSMNFGVEHFGEKRFVESMHN